MSRQTQSYIQKSNLLKEQFFKLRDYEYHFMSTVNEWLSNENHSTNSFFFNGNEISFLQLAVILSCFNEKSKIITNMAIIHSPKPWHLREISQATEKIAEIMKRLSLS